LPKTRKYRGLLALASFVLLGVVLVILFAPEDYYELRVHTEGQGLVLPGDETLIYEPGSTAILTAEPLANTNQGFVRWQGDVAGVGDSITISMDRHKSVKAVFAETPAPGFVFKTLNIVVSGDGSGTTDPQPGMYRHRQGKEVLVRALPGNGGYFEGWQIIYPERESSGVTGAVTDVFHQHAISMDEDVVLIARFSTQGYMVTLDREGGGVIVPEPGVYALAEGIPFEVKAFPDAGSRLRGWENDEGVVLEEPEKEQDIHVLKLTGPGGLYRAVFEKAERRLLVRATFADGTQGRIEPDMLGDGVPHRVSYGDSAAIMAVPENGDTAFAGWAGDLPEEFSNTQCLSPRLDLIMTENREVTAAFTKAETKLVVEAVVDGVQDERAAKLLMPAPGTYGFVRNGAAGVKLEAAMPAGNALAFVKWDGDLPDGANPQAFTMWLPMDRNRCITACFTEQQALFLVVAPAGDGLGITAPPPGQYAVSPGRVLMLEAIPQQESAFGGWRIRSPGMPDILTIENPLRWPVLKAVEAQPFFGQTPCAVSIRSSDRSAETRPPCGDYTLAKGAELLLDAKAPAGSCFHHWETSRGEILCETPQTRITVTGDEGYTAVFGSPFYALNLSVAGEGAGKIEADVRRLDRIPEGAAVHLNAHAVPDAVFSHWEGDFPGETDITLTEIVVVMDQSKKIKACFDKADYQLTITIQGLENAGDVVLLPGPGIRGYRAGTQVPLSAFPPLGGDIAFLGWTGDVASLNPEQSLILDQDCHVTAVFGPVDGDRTATLTLLPPRGTGKGSLHPLVPGRYSFSRNAAINLSFSLADGDYFGGWTDDYEGDIRCCNLPVLMDGDKTLGVCTAAAGSTLVLMLDTAEVGMTQPPPGVYRLADGMKVALTATRTDDNYAFLGWHAPGGNLLSPRPRYTVIVSSASPRRELIAVFRPYTAPPELVLCKRCSVVR